MKARQAALGLALVAAWVMTARAARAELTLEWDAPPGCPRRSEVLDRIRALAGPSFEKTEGLSAEGRIARVRGRFWLTLLVREGRDVRKRVIASDSCADLAGAGAVTLALLLGIDVGAANAGTDSNAPGREAPSESKPDRAESGTGRGDELRGERASEGGDDEPGERSDGSAERNRALPERPVAPGGSTSPSRWALVVRAPILAADVGPLPRPSFGLGLGVGMRYEAWRVVLSGHVFLGQAVSAMDPGAALGAGADLQRLTGHLGICRGWRSAQFEIAPCVGLALEHLTARGFGQGVAPESHRAVWPAPSAGIVTHWYPLNSLGIFAGVAGFIELSRPRLVIEGLGEVRQLGPAAAGATVGVEWIL